MRSVLKIGDGLRLPVSFTTQSQAILAKKRVGKSYTAKVQVEELLECGQQVVIIDITGAWYGLRSSANGKRAGYPILVAGGEHGDIPLEESAGEVMAQAIVNERFSCVLDMSLLRKGATLRFLASFLETLYRLNRKPLHLVCDEADYYAPQKPFNDEARTLGAMQDIVRRGGLRGIGSTLISQRPAVVNKDVLTQCEMLTVLRIVHHRDIDAIKDWVDVHGDPELAEEMIAELPSLPIGTAYIWSPAWPGKDGIFQKVAIRKAKTFDSGATPKVGKRIRPPKVLAKVDIKKLGASIAQTVERAKADDPAELKKRIRQLEVQVKAKKEARVEIREVADPKFEKLVNELYSELTFAKKRASEELSLVEKSLKYYAGKLEKKSKLKKNPEYEKLPEQLIHHFGKPFKIPSNKFTNGSLPKGEAAILGALIQFPDGLTHESLAVLTGYKTTSRITYVNKLKEQGYVTGVGTFVATAKGCAALPNVEPLPSGLALQDYWLGELPKGEREILRVLLNNHPKAATAAEIEELTGYKQTSRITYVNKLKNRHLVEDGDARGEVRASDKLFD